MLDAIRHRGPDDEGLHCSGAAVIGARRLAIIDLVGGHQPMLNEDGSVAAVQNGEIYNFMALREELEARGHRFHTRNDTEILPHAWEEWGEEFVPRLHGMFAIAVWDARARALLLARDRFGKKPLMYSFGQDAMLFASEIQALLAHGSISRDVDDDAILDYLTLGYIPAPRTGFAAIRKVPPGHVLVLREGQQPEIHRYWAPRYEPKVQIGIDEAAEQLRILVDRAVEKRLISDVPLGAFLSGGLDSSTVVAHMARHSDRPVKTFSVGFRDSYYDESRYARIVARAFGTEHTELTVDAGDADALPMLVRHLGEPFADSSIVPTYQIAKATRPHVTVVLTGDGGDELFAGYGRYRGAYLASHVPRAGAVALAAAGRALPVRDGVPRLIPRLRRFLSSLDRDPDERYLEWVGYFTDGLRDAVVGERLNAWPDNGRRRMLERSAAITDARHPSERSMAWDTLWYLPGDLLVKMDIATMACSLEARSPLLDHELHEFIDRLPVHYKATWTASKVLLRRAMRGIVPDEILDRRRKMGFTAPVGAWLRGPLHDVFGDVVLSSSAASRGYVSPVEIRRLFDEHRTARADRTMQLWNLLMLELWFREVASPATSIPAVATAG